MDMTKLVTPEVPITSRHLDTLFRGFEVRTIEEPFIRFHDLQHCRMLEIMGLHQIWTMFHQAMETTELHNVMDAIGLHMHSVVTCQAFLES